MRWHWGGNDAMKVKPMRRNRNIYNSSCVRDTLSLSHTHTSNRRCEPEIYHTKTHTHTSILVHTCTLHIHTHTNSHAYIHHPSSPSMSNNAHTTATALGKVESGRSGKTRSSLHIRRGETENLFSFSALLSHGMENGTKRNSR